MLKVPKKSFLGFALVAALLILVPSANAKPGKIHLSVADPAAASSAAPASGHSATWTWTPSSDGSANPTLGYNMYLWPATGTAPNCTGTTCTGVVPLNATLVGVGCTSSATCTFTTTAIGPGSYSSAVTAFLNGSESVLSNIVNIVIKPAAPALSITSFALNVNGRKTVLSATWIDSDAVKKTTYQVFGGSTLLASGTAKESAGKYSISVSNKVRPTLLLVTDKDGATVAQAF